MCIGLVGYGLGGRIFHAPFIPFTQGLELVGIATGDPERHGQAARDFPGVRLYPSLGELLRADTRDGQEQALRAGQRPAGNDRWGAQDHLNWGLVRGDERELVPCQRGRHDRFYAPLDQALRGAGPLPVEGEQALACLDVLDAARRRALTGEVVPMG